MALLFAGLGRSNGRTSVESLEYEAGEPTMLQKADNRIADRAKKIYNDRLKGVLEATEPNKFVAIEPESGDYFVGVTLSEAIGKSREKHPKRLAHAIRVGHRAAVHFGMHVQ